MWNFAYFELVHMRKFRPLSVINRRGPICIIIKLYIYIFYDKCKILSYSYYFLAEAEMSIIMFSPHKLCDEDLR